MCPLRDMWKVLAKRMVGSYQEVAKNINKKIRISRPYQPAWKHTIGLVLHSCHGNVHTISKRLGQRYTVAVAMYIITVMPWLYIVNHKERE